MGTMDKIIDTIADTTEKVTGKVADTFGRSDEQGATPTGAHRGEPADEGKPGLMDSLADATVRLVDKFDGSEPTAPDRPNPPAQIPAAPGNIDPSGKV